MSEKFKRYVAEERAKSTAEHALVSILSELGHSTLTVALLWSMFPASDLLIWFACAATVSFIVFILHNQVLPDKPHYTPRRWFYSVTCSSFSVGFVWGMVPVLFFSPDNIVYLAFIIALYAGYVSGGLSVTFTHQPSFVAFSTGITLPFAARMFYQDEQVYNTIGALAIFYVAMLIYVSKNMNTLFLETAKIQFANLQLVEDLAREKEAVEQAVSAKDRFLAAASHDLRQPLNAISLFVDALRPLQTKAAGNQIIEKIRLSLKGLNSMLHSLLDISRLDAGAVDSTPKHTSLTTLTAQLVEEYQAKATHLRIVNELDEEYTVFANPTLVYRVVRNLVDNAVKYTNEGVVTLRARQDDNAVLLEIEDTGIGIPQEKLATVFDEFEQLNNPERNREKGLGLGLAIVKRLCDLGKIEIQLKSKLGHGTLVSLSLRRGVVTEPGDDTQPNGDSLHGRLIAVIDDERTILDGMQHLVSSWGCDTIVGESQDEIMAALTRQSRLPDLIISDLRLREGHRGIDVIDAICEEYNTDIPAILVTGDTAPEHITEAQQSGLSVIYKPVDVQILQAEVIKLIQ